MSLFKRPWTRRTGNSDAAKVDPPPESLTATESVPESAPARMTATGRDFSRFEGNDVRLKFWLSDVMDEALADLEGAMHVSRSELVRMTLFQYLYGRYDYVAMQVQKLGFFRPVGVRPGLQYSRRWDPPALQRKKLNDVSVFLPQCMKDDLLVSAGQMGVPLSVHIREILISELLGRLYLPDRFRLTTPAEDRDLAVFEDANGSPVGRG